MADGFNEIKNLETPAALAELNRMIRELYDMVPSDNDTIKVYKGYGSPENAVSASIGSLYQRLDGGANTTLYVKESGSADTGWIAK